MTSSITYGWWSQLILSLKLVSWAPLKGTTGGKNGPHELLQEQWTLAKYQIDFINEICEVEFKHGVRLMSSDLERSVSDERNFSKHIESD